MVRVRFAPSPTGFLHIGGARTALFNYLFAKNKGGKFILRIEDTDAARSKKEYEENIFESLKWLGMEWDELYRQSERTEIYRDNLKKLFDQNKVYKCFCTKEELDEKRKRSELLRKAYKYDGKCRKLSKEETAGLERSGKPYSIRFKIEEGRTEINDLVRGKITFENSELDDIVLIRTDGIPTYNFCVVIDDALMNITHIIRGEDHISNTPRQILLNKALGFALPEFAHIPLILGADKTRLSKREGAISVTEFKETGYLPEALINFLALLGASYDADKDIYTFKELISRFSMEKVNKSPSIFNTEKLDYLNGYYIRQKTEDEILALLKPYLDKANIKTDDDKIKKVIKLEKERLKVLSKFPEMTKYFFTEDFTYDKAACDKHFKNPETISLLKEYVKLVATTGDFSAQNLEKISREFVASRSLKLGQLVHPVRLALTGKLVSPGLFEVMETLGRETCIKRLNKIQTL